MSYKYITKYDSPNFTKASQVKATWGEPRTFKAIAIHWWGDPKTKPTLMGVVNTLCNPARQASAHFVASGTNREVAQLVNMSDASWATNSANPYTISIECDPRCRDEDYDVVAELISQIRSAYGDLPLVPHKKYVATACPGNYDLKKLDKIARTKDGSGKWGTVKDKVIVTTKDVTTEIDIPFETVTTVDETLPVGQNKVTTKGVDGVRTIVTTVTYTNGKKTKEVVKSDKVTKKPVNEVITVGTYVPPVEVPPEGPESPSEPPVDPNQPTTPETPQKPVQSLRELLTAIWQWVLKFWNMK